MDRLDVFHTQQDREVYLALVQQHLAGTGASVFAYCLMTNHVHWIVKPADEHSLGLLFQRVHGRYAQYFNPLRSRSGHLWQNRYFSCPLSTSHLKIAVQYVEWNPIRAGLVEQSEDYKWSSAAAHLIGPAKTQNLSLDWDMWNARGGAAYWWELLATQPDMP